MKNKVEVQVFDTALLVCCPCMLQDPASDHSTGRLDERRGSASCFLWQGSIQRSAKGENE